MNNKTLPTTLNGFFWYFIKKQWLAALILSFTILAWALQESLYPYFIKLIIDKITEFTGEKHLLLTILSPLLIKSIIVVLTLELMFRIHDFTMAKFMPKFKDNIRTSMFHYVQKHSHKYFLTNMPGTISGRIIRMADGMDELIIQIVTTFLPITVSFMISIVLLYLSKPVFAYMVIIWFSSHLIITILFASKCRYYSAKASAKTNILQGKIVDCITNISNVRLFSNYKYENKYFYKYQKEQIKAAEKSLFYNALMKLFLGITSTTFIFLMVGSGIYFYQKDIITLADLALILSYQNLIGLLWYMSMNIIFVYDVLGHCTESLNLVNTPYEITDKDKAADLIVTEGKIEFKHVTFNYEDNDNIFADTSLVIPSKQKVGLVGFSGSGKTTFVSLILRNFDIRSGEILIDNQNVMDVKQDSLRKQIAIIPQESILFHRTIMENIKYGNIDATDDEVIEAAKKAYAHDFIINLPDKYNTMVGERGTKLSGGQRQRIAIARAILKNTKILVLDEATSALDSISEYYIQQSLRDLMKDKTVIIIAHRLSTLLHLDRILVFSRGNIVEDGTHQELISKNGQYTKLWNVQSGELLPKSL